MKKNIAILLVLMLSLSLFACGKDGDDTKTTTGADTTAAQSDDSTKADETKADETKADETTVKEVETTEAEAATEVSLVATCSNCTITVPKLETFFDGYKGTTVKYNNPEPHLMVYVNLYGEDSNLEVNASVTQLSLSSVATQDAKGYAEYYNSTSKMYVYNPVEIAGFSGYLAEKSVKGTLSTTNVYLIDYPLSDGTSVVIRLNVAQKNSEDTKEMTALAEAILKNIQVAPLNA